MTTFELILALVMVVASLIALSERLKIKKLMATFKNISELVKVYKEAISDGKLSEKEKDRLIEHIVRLIRRWI